MALKISEMELMERKACYKALASRANCGDNDIRNALRAGHVERTDDGFILTKKGKEFLGTLKLKKPRNPKKEIGRIREYLDYVHAENGRGTKDGLIRAMDRLNYLETLLT